MKKFVLLAVLLAIAVSPAAATEWVGLFEDQTGLDCEVPDAGAGIKRVYVVHHSDNGTSASEFLIDATSTTFGVISSVPGAGFLAIGSAETGVSISYQQCMQGTFVALTMTYETFGTTPACSRIVMLEDPNAVPPARIYIDCPGFQFTFIGGQAIVQANGTCPCNVATEDATWGSIKALYR